MANVSIDPSGKLPPLAEITYTVSLYKGGKQTNSAEIESEEKVEQLFAEIKKKNPHAIMTMIAKDMYDINY